MPNQKPYPQAKAPGQATGPLPQEDEGYILSALWAVPWEQLSAKNYPLDYDPVGPRNTSLPGLQSQVTQGRILTAVTKTESPDVKSGRQMCVQLLSRSYWCFGVRQRESAKMVPSGEIKGGGENKGKQRKKRKMVCASFCKAEGEHGECHPPAGLLPC